MATSEETNPLVIYADQLAYERLEILILDDEERTWIEDYKDYIKEGSTFDEIAIGEKGSVGRMEENERNGTTGLATKITLRKLTGGKHTTSLEQEFENEKI